MILALDLKKGGLAQHSLLVVKGSELYLRDVVRGMLGEPAKVIDALAVPTIDIVGLIKAKSVSEKSGCIVIINAEGLKDDVGFDLWLHKKERERTVVLLVSSGEKLLTHYSRVVGRRGAIIDCDLPIEREESVKRWIKDFAARQGVRLPLAMVHELMERCGDLMSIKNELIKLQAGFGGRVLTTSLLDRVVLSRSGGIPLVADAIFDKDKRCVKLAACCFDQGVEPVKLIRGIVRQIMRRIRLKEAGDTARTAVQVLGFDPRYAYRQYAQATEFGTIAMWKMVEELSLLESNSFLVVPKLLLWLAAKVRKPFIY